MPTYSTAQFRQYVVDLLQQATGLTISIPTILSTAQYRGLVVDLLTVLAQGGGGSGGNATQLQGRNISATAPTSGQVLAWNGTVWIPTAASGGGGTVTSVALSGGTTGLTTSGGPITGSGTITLGGTLGVANGGTGATTLTGYVKGSGTAAFTASATVPAADVSGALAATNLPALSGDLTSTAGSNSITVAKLRGQTVSATAPTSGQILKFDGTQWAPSTDVGITALTGDVTASGSGSVVATLSNTGVTASSYGSATAVPILTVDEKGRISAASNQTITPANIGAEPTITTLTVAKGGTGASTLTGYVKGNGTGAFTASATIAAADVSGLLSASNLPALSGDVTTTAGAASTTVVALRGRSLAATAPTSGQVLGWNGSTSTWEPTTVSAGGGGTVTSIIFGSGLTGGTITTTGIVAVNFGTTGGTVTQGGTTVLKAGDSMTGALSIGINANSDALTITQAGNGNAFVVGTNALIIDKTGHVGIGLTPNPSHALRVDTGGIFTQGGLTFGDNSVQTTAGVTSLTGDVTTVGAGASAATVAKIRGITVSATAPTSGQVLKYDGTQWAPAADTASNVTGTVAIANGGTGQTTANAALNALLPAQTGNNTKLLSTDGTNTSWTTAFKFSNTKVVGVDAPTIQGCIDLVSSATALAQAQVLIPAGVYNENLTLKPCVSLASAGLNNGQSSIVRIVGTHTLTGGTSAGDNIIQLNGLRMDYQAGTSPTLTISATGTTPLLVYMQDCMIGNSNASTSSVGVLVNQYCSLRCNNVKSVANSTSGSGGTHVEVNGGTFYGDQFSTEYGTLALRLSGTGGAFKPYAELKQCSLSCTGSNVVDITSTTALFSAGWTGFTNNATTGNGINIAASSVIGVFNSVFVITAGASNYVVTGAFGGVYYSLNNSYSNATGVPYETKVNANISQFLYSSSIPSALTALTGDVTASGTGSQAASVVRIQGRNVSSTAPTSGQVLAWNGTAWTPTTSSGSGTVTSVAVSGGTTGLTTSGGPITSSGTITLAGTLGVANGGTGATTLTGYVKGNGTSAFTASATVSAADVSGALAASNLPALIGDLSSTAGSNSITVTKIRGIDVSATAPTNGQVLKYNGIQWVPSAEGSGGITALTGDVTASGSGSVVATLANSGVTAGNYGSSNAVAVLSIDAKGRVTSASNQTITPAGIGAEPAFSTLPVSKGGTGVNTLTGILKGNGTSAFQAAVAGTDYVIPSGSITGTSLNVTGIVAIANGGTGQTTASAALNALLPSQTGNSGKVLSTDGTNASWITSSGGSATPTNRQVFLASGTWTKPTGAKVVLIRAVGHGFGGGAGSRGMSVKSVSGGTGGASGPISEIQYDATALPSSLTITVPSPPLGGFASFFCNTVGAVPAVSSVGYTSAKAGNRTYANSPNVTNGTNSSGSISFLNSSNAGGVSSGLNSNAGGVRYTAGPITAFGASGGSGGHDSGSTSTSSPSRLLFDSVFTVSRDAATAQFTTPLNGSMPSWSGAFIGNGASGGGGGANALNTPFGGSGSAGGGWASPVTLTNVSTTAGSTTVTCSSTAGLQATMSLPEILPNLNTTNVVQVETIVNSTTFTINIAAATTASGLTVLAAVGAGGGGGGGACTQGSTPILITGVNLTSGSTTVDCTSTRGILVGLTIFKNANIPDGTTVASLVSETQFTISAAATGTETAGKLVVAGVGTLAGVATTSGSATVSATSTLGIRWGQAIVAGTSGGALNPSSTSTTRLHHIAAVTSSTGFVVSANALSTASSLTGTVMNTVGFLSGVSCTASSAVVTVSDTSPLYAGMLVHLGVQGNWTTTAGSTATLSSAFSTSGAKFFGDGTIESPSSANVSGTTVTFNTSSDVVASVTGQYFCTRAAGGTNPLPETSSASAPTASGYSYARILSVDSATQITLDTNALYTLTGLTMMYAFAAGNGGRGSAGGVEITTYF